MSNHRNGGRKKEKDRKPSVGGDDRGQQRRVRLTTLAETIRGYDPDFESKALENAFKWSNRRFKSPRYPTRNDHFSDPLMIAERLAEFKADSETILAAVLYPAARPVEGRGIDNAGLSDIQEKFGDRIHNLVVNTLELRALQRLRIRSETRQTKEEQLSFYKLMCLWTARDPRAIFIRSVQNLLNIENFSAAGRREKDDVVEEAKEIIAPIAYIAGYSSLRRAILDAVYRLENPSQFALVSRSMSKAPVRENAQSEDGALKREVKVTDQDFEELKQKVAAVLMNKCGLIEGQFAIEARRKSAASARAKAIAKKKTIEQLGDKFGFRVILYAEPGKTTDLRRLDPAERDELLRRLGAECRRIYAQLSQQFGRGSRNSVLRQEFAKLVDFDPRLDAEGKPTGEDDRFDDYIKHPKPSGYSAMQDTFFVEVGGKLVEFEGQIVDEVRHDINTYGPRTGHVYYKANMPGQADYILDWYQAASEVMGETAADTPSNARRHVLVYDPLNQISIFEEPATAGDFVGRLFNSYAGDITSVRIDNDNPFASRDPDAEYALSVKLKNGDRISPVVRESQPAFS